MSPTPPDASVRSSGPGPSRLPRWLAVAIAASLVLGASAPAVADIGDSQPSRAARLVVNGLRAVVGPPSEQEVPDGEEGVGLPSRFAARVLVENEGDVVLDGLRLVVAVHERVTTRSTLRAALEPGSSAIGGVETLALDLPLDPVQPGAIAQVDVDFDAVEAGLIGVEDVTIHPVAISVARGVNVLDEARTAAIGVARPVARPLSLVAVAPLDGPPTDDERTAAALLPGGRLDRILRALETAPPGSVTTAPAPHAVEALDRLVAAAVPGATDVRARLDAVVDERAAGVVSTPYAYADVPALAVASSTEDLATAAIVAGRQRLPALLDVVPAGAHLLVAEQTDDALGLVPADVLLATWDDASGPDLVANPSADIPPARRTHRTDAGRSLVVLVGDPWITEGLATADGRQGWELDAHRQVAETAMLFASAPGRDGRVVAVVPPLAWEAPGMLPDELYLRLATAPWLRPTDPVTAAAAGSTAAPWGPRPSVGPERTALLARVATIETRLSGLAASVADMEAPPPVVTRTDDLLRAASAWPTTAPLERARRILDQLAEDVDAAIGTVVVPDDSVITLTSERGVLPITVQHPDGVPMDVLVEVAAQGRLSFPEGTTRAVRLEEGGTTTVSFEAVALGRGTFPMAVTVRTLTGEVPLADELVEVRASAVSRPALVAIAVVVGILLLVGRLRRPRERHLEVVR